MTYKSHTTSSINFEGLQMKLKRPIKTMPNMVSIFMASQCGIFFNIRTLLIYFLIFQKIILENDFLILKKILENIFLTLNFEFILI